VREQARRAVSPLRDVRPRHRRSAAVTLQNRLAQGQIVCVMACRAAVVTLGVIDYATAKVLYELLCLTLPRGSESDGRRRRGGGPTKKHTSRPKPSSRKKFSPDTSKKSGSRHSCKHGGKRKRRA
jgi:hypothetical protein